MEIKKIPYPGPGQNEIGWEVRCEFLEEIMGVAMTLGGEEVSMGQAEAVILALLKYRHCELEDE